MTRKTSAHTTTFDRMTRRKALKSIVARAAGGAAMLSMPAVWKRAHGAQTLVVSDPGGEFAKAFGEAFYKPFTKETGIEIVYTARKANPASLIKAAVETKTYAWDVTTTTRGIYELVRAQNLLEPLDTSGSDIAEIPGEFKTDYWVGVDITGFIIAYRTDTKFGENGPGSYADVWDVKKFPGRRAFRKVGRDVIETALRADGVPGGPDIYKVLSTPEGWDRAFKSLDRIKPHVDVWWSQSPESTQLLKTGEVDICPTWNARAQVAIDAGAPVKLEWNGGFTLTEGWVIPKGNPKLDLGRQFIKFASRADRQAVYTEYLAYGPTNPGAYKYIDQKRAKLLPTHPDNIRKIAAMDENFWGANHEKAEQRLAEWLLK